MNEHDAAEALERIERGLSLDRPDQARWLSAFENVQWVAVSQSGYLLTDAGREALRDFSRKHALRAARRSHRRGDASSAATD